MGSRNAEVGKKEKWFKAEGLKNLNEIWEKNIINFFSYALKITSSRTNENLAINWN